MARGVWHRLTGAVLKGHFVPEDRKRSVSVMASLEGHRAELAIRKAVARRSLPQNSKLHVLARLLAFHTGDSLLTVKRRATLEALGLERGIVTYEVHGQQFRDVRATSSLSKQESSAVIEALLKQCSFLELTPPPDEHVEVMA